MTIEIVSSYWSADESLFPDRVTQAFVVIEKVFPKVTFWNARPSHPTSPGDQFKAKREEEINNLGGSLGILWQKTLSYFSEQRKDLNTIGVRTAVFSTKLAFAIGMYFDEYQMSIEVEPAHESTALKENLDKLLLILRELGTCSGSGGWWLRHKSAFAGDPVLLYEPKIPFAKFYDPVRYDEVIDQVREVRESVRAAVSPADFTRILQELGLEVEALPGGRVFVRLGDPLDKNGITMMKRIEQKIGPLLKIDRDYLYKIF